MKAIIVGAPIELDGEPAEIAQLVDLLTSGRVAVEHVHRWRIDELDGAESVKGRCWCGQERDFDPQLPRGPRKPSIGITSGERRVATVNTVAVKKGSGGARNCANCGQHPRSKIHQTTCKGGR